jgi:hypothetical protein
MTAERTIWIAGVARSGTSWLGQIFNSHPAVRFRFQPLFAYEFKNQINEDSSSNEFNQFLNELWNSETEFLTQADKVASGEYPHFGDSDSQSVLAFKENRYQSMIEPMLRKIPSMHLVGIVRHPCAVIHSWSRNSREFPAGSVLRDQWRFGQCKNETPADYFGYYKWKEVANLYLDLTAKYPERAKTIRYADLLQQPEALAQAVLNHCGLDLSPGVKQFLVASRQQKSQSYYSVFNSKSNDHAWREKLDPHIASEIEADLAGTRLEPFLAD